MASSVSKPILHLPPLGKPDPHEPYTGIYPDHRPRVIQKPLKGEFPWYYAMNLIRERIGPNLANPTDPAACRKREIERSFSLLRKEKTRIGNNLPDTTNQLDAPSIHHLFSSITPQNLSSLNSYQQSSLLLLTNSDPKFLGALQGFANQTRFTDFYQYLIGLRYVATKELYAQFLHSYNIDPKTSFEKDLQSDPELKHYFNNKSWEELDDIDQSSLFERYVVRLAAEKYNLQKSSWKPTMPIEFLIQEIETHGPIYVVGPFGINFYLESPYKMHTQVDGQDIYAWKPNSSTKEKYLCAYAIVLIGAQKTSQSQELVYFVDPNDESNPAAPQKRRVFAMSYKKLCSDIADLNLTWREHPPGTVSYAYYGPQKALEEEAAKVQRAFLEAFPLD